MERARALAPVVVLAELAGWQLEMRPDSPIRFLKDHRYTKAGDLLLVPLNAKNSDERITNVLAKARCDGLAPGMGKTNDGRDTMYISIAVWTANGIDWHRAWRLWAAPSTGDLWFVPDPDGEDRDGCCFRFGQQLRAVNEHPWADFAERDAGLLAADLLVADRLRKLESARPIDGDEGDE
ncbi:hypothetical protein [uncultured Sphingomonas sp.]|uniref:hypothetical protein n=1 Tax=uncultured Sphingomonas sp. TaxID=158754 RepID=UPI002623C281|nr:hypothetical protein [uncultured Sphingomonas sp.]